MNQLSTNKDTFEFLPFTDITMKELPEWMGSLYEDALGDGSAIYDEPSFMADYIPTKFMVINYAYNYFDQHCYHWALNGHDPSLWDDIQWHHADGMDEEEIQQMWFEMRDNNAGYGVEISEDSIEKKFMRDINRGLNLYHLSYIQDGFKENVYNCPERVIIEEWVNPPIVRVW
jgi:hypothetical protein